MILTSASVYETCLDPTVQAKTAEQFSTVVLFITLLKVVLTFEFVDEILKCNHLDESH